MSKFIPVNQPIIDPTDIKAVTKSLKSGWISSEGPNVKKFEEKFSKFIGHKFRGKYLDCGTMNGYIKSTIEISKL